MPRPSAGLLLFITVLCSCAVLVCSVRLTFPLIRAMGLRMLRSYMAAKMESAEQRLDNILTSLSEEMLHLLPPSVKTRGIDMKKPGGGYICSSQATISGLESIKKTDKIKLNEDEDGTMVISVNYTIGRVDVLFEKLVFEYYFTKEMQLLLTFHEGKIVVQLRLQSLLRILRRIFTRECVIHIKRLEVTEIQHVGIEMSDYASSQKSIFTSLVAETMLETNYDSIIGFINAQLVVDLYRALVSSGSWVCKDPALEAVVKEKYAHKLGARKPSKDFLKHCANVNENTLPSKDKRP